MFMRSKCQDWSITVGQEFISLVLLQRFLEVGPATWQIVTVDENKRRSLATELCVRLAQSSAFHLTVLMPVLTDAMKASSKQYNLADDEGIEHFKRIIYSSQLRSKMILPLYALSEFFSKAEKMEHCIYQKSLFKICFKF